MMTKEQNLTSLLRSLARESGFDQIGFAPAQPVEQSERYLSWIQHGNQGDMTWLSRRINERLNPALLMPGVLSVAVFALNYFHPYDTPESPDNTRISRYAWGKDYHDVVGEKLNNISINVKTIIPDIECRCFVDTSPIMEKYWAVKSGIGWQGKHTIVISPEFGSWIFLGVMLMNQELIYDSPIESRCRDCDLCIKACPTSAISEPGVLNAGKCISYWTIERKEQTGSEDVSGKLNQYIYGCDICQNVCPWNNRLQKTSTDKSFSPVKKYLSRNEIFQMDDFVFEQYFSGSPIARIGLKRLKQNALALFGS